MKPTEENETPTDPTQTANLTQATGGVGEHNNGVEKLGRDLISIGQRAARMIREHRIRTAFLAAIDQRPMLLLLIVPLLQILTLGFYHLVSKPGGELPVWGLLLATLALPFLYILGHAYRAAGKTLEARAALAEVDRRLGLEDRLQTAAQFLDVAERTPFMNAAVEDATRFTERALAEGWVTPRDQWQWPRGGTPLLLAALGFFLFASWLDSHRLDALLTPAGGNSEQPLAFVEENEKRRPSDEPLAPTLEEEVRPEAPPVKRPPGNPTVGKPGKPQLDDGQDIKKTKGKTQAGASANANSASGSSEARGNPTAQGQSSQESQKKAPPKKKKKKKKKRPEKEDDEPEKAKKEEEDSGATAGRGAASGSNKSPSASTWSSKDQVTSEDEEDLEDDEEVDDEFEDNDSRGGLQPQLRDRKPPVNRDLTIGFGNGKNPDANGRGGPSQQKKSRGVASLVLGVPIPDHIKGRPNPGKTKVTQERVEPQVEETLDEMASDRGSRQAPVGYLASPELSPWMHDFLKRYYLSVRAEGEQAEASKRPAQTQ